MPELSASSARRIAGASEESRTNSPNISVAPSSEPNPGLEACDLDLPALAHTDQRVRIPRVPAAEEVDQAVARLDVGGRGRGRGERQNQSQKGDFSHGAHVNTRLRRRISRRVTELSRLAE